MPWYVLTGAPGAGKTAILRQLEHDGYAVVEEAATDVIALEHALGRPAPWRRADFPDQIARLQRRRERLAAEAYPVDAPVFFDRSVVCTLALSRFLGRPLSPLLAAEIDRVVRDEVYARPVFFVRSQGFVTPTEARQITLADSLAFEEVHELTYRELGFTLIDVPAGPLAARAALVRGEVLRLAAAALGSVRPGKALADRESADHA